MATIRQKKLAKILAIDNKLTAKEASIKAGYSVNTNLDPVMKSQTFQDLLDKYISDKLITKTHKQAFKATKLVTSPTEPDREVPDWQSRLKAVELGYKVKGRMIENVSQVNVGDIQIKVIDDKPIIRGDE